MRFRHGSAVVAHFRAWTRPRPQESSVIHVPSAQLGRVGSAGAVQPTAHARPLSTDPAAWRYLRRSSRALRVQRAREWRPAWSEAAAGWSVRSTNVADECPRDLLLAAGPPRLPGA